MTEKEYRAQPMIVKELLEKMKIAEEKAQKKMKNQKSKRPESGKVETGRKNKNMVLVR